jgi:hypothetical protein
MLIIFFLIDHLFQLRLRKTNSHTKGSEQTGSHNTQIFRARSYSYQLSNACAPVQIPFYGGLDGYDAVFCLV